MSNKKKFDKKAAETLFTLAKEFNEIKPWKWLGDTDVFGIKFHDMEDIIFCSVLGMGDEVYGMAIYTGFKGIESYFKLLDFDSEIEEEAIYIQDALTINFDDRKDITEEDYSLIKFSGVNFRGKKEWPNFKRYEPGFVPWNLTDDELLLMIRILEATKQSALYYKENPDKAELMQEGKCCVMDFKADGSFEERIIEYNKLGEQTDLTIEVPIIYNELEVKRLKKACKKINSTWEIDSFYNFIPVDDEEVPFFPVILLMVDKNNGTIIGNNMSHPYAVIEESQKYVLETISNMKVIPTKVVISNYNLFMYLEDLFNKLGVRMELVESLEIIPDIKEEMFESMKGL